MFTSLAQSAVEASALRARWDADEERQTEFANRLDLYADDYEAIIRNMIDKLFHKSNADRLHYHVNQTQNVPKRIVNEGSTVYKVPATRTVGKGVDIPRWTSIAEAIDFGTRMKRLNRLVNLLNEVIVKPTVRRGALTLDFITPNRCSVIQNEEDPTVADAYLFSRSWVNTVSASELAEYEFWGVDGNVYLLDEHFRLKQTIYTPEDYPYRDPRTREPVLPMVAFHRQPPEDTFWDQDSGRDLYNAGVLAGVKMTLFDYYFKTASFKQIYVIGGGDVPSVRQ